MEQTFDEPVELTEEETDAVTGGDGSFPFFSNAVSIPQLQFSLSGINVAVSIG